MTTELAASATTTRRLHAVSPDDPLDRGIDRAGAVAAVEALLTALGRDPGSTHLADTPRRVADALIELLSPRPFAATTFANDEHYDGLVVVADIPFNSLCEHHLLPFRGVAHVGYVPGDRLVGLSKLARVVMVRLRIRVQPARKKKITRIAKNSWIAACGAEVAIRSSIELGVSTATVRSAGPPLAPNSPTMSSMNFSRLA